MRLGYNTNGLAHHRLNELLRLIADEGYEACALTLDTAHLDPFRVNAAEIEATRKLADELSLALAIETGARFLLNPQEKHRPTLLEATAEDRARRVDFLKRSVQMARDLGAGIVSLWAGTPPAGESDRETLWARLCEGLVPVLDAAQENGVQIAFEPEPGMFLERPGEYRELVQRLGDRGSELGLCLDVGHCLCTNDLPVDAVIREYADQLVHVHLDDIAGGVHEHCMFGDGDLDLSGVLAALDEIDYQGIAAVELSRDSHRGAWAAREAMRHLRAARAE